MKLIIAGSRSIHDKEWIYSKLNSNFDVDEIDEVVSGNADGPDKIGEKWAEEHNIDVKIFPPDWEKYGQSAGHIRNWEMAEYADALAAFWDGESPGTKSMIEKAEREKISRQVFFYNNE